MVRTRASSALNKERWSEMVRRYPRYRRVKDLTVDLNHRVNAFRAADKGGYLQEVRAARRALVDELKHFHQVMNRGRPRSSSSEEWVSNSSANTSRRPSSSEEWVENTPVSQQGGRVRSDTVRSYNTASSDSYNTASSDESLFQIPARVPVVNVFNNPPPLERRPPNRVKYANRVVRELARGKVRTFKTTARPLHSAWHKEWLKSKYKFGGKKSKYKPKYRN